MLAVKKDLGLLRNLYLYPLLMAMRKNVLVFLSCILFFSCGETAEEEEALPFENTTAVFGDPQFRFPELLPAVESEILHWNAMEDFIAAAKELNGSTYGQLQIRSEQLKSHCDSIFVRLPDTLNTSPIRSRLLVLQTRSEVLHQNTSGGKTDEEAINRSLDELNLAISNLLNHFNEKFKKDAIDRQRLEDERSELQKLRDEAEKEK